MSMRVINLGLPKSGTTTFWRALRRGSIYCADRKVLLQDVNGEKSEAYVAELMYQGFFDLGDPVGYLAGVDALAEISVLKQGLSLWPQCDFAIIDALRRRHPDLLFVATRRNSEALARSMLAWSDMGERLERLHIPGLPAGYGETTKARIAWIDGHYAHLRAIFAGDPRFLELDVAAPDARSRLAAHLGVDLPWWGRSNTNPLSRQPRAS